MNEITIPTNRTNRSIRQSCTGSLLSLMRCNCPIDDCTCRIDSELFHLTNRTNRSIRQSCTGSPLSLMRCNCPIDDRTCRIDSKLFHLTNRTNRSDRQHFGHFSLMKCNFPIDNRENVVLSDGIYLTVLDMSFLILSLDPYRL